MVTFTSRPSRFPKPPFLNAAPTTTTRTSQVTAGTMSNSTRLTPEEARVLIESAGRIPMRTFQVTIGVLAGLALCCFILRIAIRLRYQKRLRLDDAFLIVAAICLCAATGILYHVTWFLYLHTAALHIPRLLPYLLRGYADLLAFQKKIYPFLDLAQTATYAVKGCFLVFMRPLIWHISRKVNWYYWSIVGFCIIAWAYTVVMPFILCPYFGAQAGKLYHISKSLKLLNANTNLESISQMLCFYGGGHPRPASSHGCCGCRRCGFGYHEYVTSPCSSLFCFDTQLITL